MANKSMTIAAIEVTVVDRMVTDWNDQRMIKPLPSNWAASYTLCIRTYHPSAGSVSSGFR